MNYNKRRNIILIAIILAIIAVLLVVILTVKKLTSKDYKLGKLGYTFDEINIILNNDKITFNEVMNMEYDKNLPKIIEEKYFIKDNLKDYLEFQLKDSYYDRKLGRGIDYNHLILQDKGKLLRKFIDTVNDLLLGEGKDELDL